MGSNSSNFRRSNSGPPNREDEINSGGGSSSSGTYRHSTRGQSNSDNTNTEEMDSPAEDSDMSESESRPLTEDLISVFQILIRKYVSITIAEAKRVVVIMRLT